MRIISLYCLIWARFSPPGEKRRKLHRFNNVRKWIRKYEYRLVCYFFSTFEKIIKILLGYILPVLRIEQNVRHKAHFMNRLLTLNLSAAVVDYFFALQITNLSRTRRVSLKICILNHFTLEYIYFLSVTNGTRFW